MLLHKWVGDHPWPLGWHKGWVPGSCVEQGWAGAREPEFTLTARPHPLQSHPLSRKSPKLGPGSH